MWWVCLAAFGGAFAANVVASALMLLLPRLVGKWAARVRDAAGPTDEEVVAVQEYLASVRRNEDDVIEVMRIRNPDAKPPKAH